MLADLKQRIPAKRRALDSLRPLRAEALSKLELYYNLELTYTSIAIEGNTLSAVETTIVIEQGITIGGKPLRDHLEAIDHHAAIRYVRDLAERGTRLGEVDVLGLHALVVQRSHPDIAGRYADQPRSVRTEAGRHAFPKPAELPALMGDFGAWLGSATSDPDTAFRAHLRLVGIHPFNDGNGRTARLLMNLLLIRAGYPPIPIRPEDRLTYIRALQAEQAGEGAEAFDTLMYERLDATLDDFIAVLSGAEATCAS